MKKLLKKKPLPSKVAKVIEKVNKVAKSVEQEPTPLISGTIMNPQPEITTAPSTQDIKIVKPTKIYQVPETKEDLLALHKCLKDSGFNSIGDIEVRASRA